MSGLSVRIDIAAQELELCEGERVLACYPVSTALKGVGEREGSECTPRGQHVVSEKFGENAPLNAVFVARKATGEVWSPELAAASPDRDWILTRILWLDGCETGRNRGGNVDTKRRFIYIHGTPENEPMGLPRSHGCIRMRNADIMELFDRVPEGTPVEIIEGTS